MSLKNLFKCLSKFEFLEESLSGQIRPQMISVEVRTLQAPWTLRMFGLFRCSESTGVSKLSILKIKSDSDAFPKSERVKQEERSFSSISILKIFSNLNSKVDDSQIDDFRRYKVDNFKADSSVASKEIEAPTWWMFGMFEKRKFLQMTNLESKFWRDKSQVRSDDYIRLNRQRVAWSLELVALHWSLAIQARKW